MGYTLEEIEGNHHSQLGTPECETDPEYQRMWDKLAKGEFVSGDFERRTKSGQTVWIHGSYNPIFGPTGQPYKVVKYAHDVTARKAQEAEFKSLVDAVNLVQAVVEFDLEGHVLKANDTFLKTFGYEAHEVLGQHHRMFCDPAYAASASYPDFWAKLARGEPTGGECQRVTKSGKVLWLSGSYNPVYDANGKVFKFIKFANDVTHRKMRSAEFEEHT